MKVLSYFWHSWNLVASYLLHVPDFSRSAACTFVYCMHCACAAFAGLREDLSLTTEDGPYETSSCFGWSGTKHTALKTKLNRLIYGIMRYNPLQWGTELSAFLTAVFSYLADIPFLLCMGAQCRAPCWEGEVESAALMQTRGTWALQLSADLGFILPPSPCPPVLLSFCSTEALPLRERITIKVHLTCVFNPFVRPHWWSWC